MYLYVKQKYNKRNKELHEDAWSYGVVTPSLSHTHIYIVMELYIGQIQILLRVMSITHMLSLIRFQVTNSVFLLLLFFYCVQVYVTIFFLFYFKY